MEQQNHSKFIMQTKSTSYYTENMNMLPIYRHNIIGTTWLQNYWKNFVHPLQNPVLKCHHQKLTTLEEEFALSQHARRKLAPMAPSHTQPRNNNNIISTLKITPIPLSLSTLFQLCHPVPCCFPLPFSLFFFFLINQKPHPMFFVSVP